MKSVSRLHSLHQGDLPNFLETFLFVDRFEQNLHSICKMKNKIYFARDIFPVFFLVFFLFTVLWTNCNKIVFTHIPKVSFGARKKTKSVLESQINLENYLWPFF